MFSMHYISVVYWIWCYRMYTHQNRQCNQYCNWRTQHHL